MIAGTVIEGTQVARTLGFPTANLDIMTNHGLETAGVYCVTVDYDGQLYRGVLCVNWNDQLEVHILDFDKMIYGKQLIVTVVKFIRYMEFIEDVDRLRAVIAHDVEVARSGF